MLEGWYKCLPPVERPEVGFKNKWQEKEMKELTDSSS